MQRLRQHHSDKSVGEIRAASHTKPIGSDLAFSLSNPHIPALDGIRGLAILLVLLCHFTIYGGMQPKVFVDKLFFAVTVAGWCGVDLFFVLSGFLITGILYDAKGSKFFFRNFYMRRCLRIFPLYYGVLAVVFVIIPFFFTLGRNHEFLFKDQAWYWSYLINIKIALEERWPKPIALAHFWSLAVEEQFYFVWPLVVFLLGRGTLIKVCVACMLGALSLRIGLAWTGNPHAANVLAPARMDALALGALLALLARHPNGLLRWRSYAWSIGGCAGVVLAAIFVWKRGLYPKDFWVVTFGYSLLAFFFGSILTLVLTSPQGSVLKNLFCSRGLRLLGVYSYGLYVFHQPIEILIRKHLTVAELPTLFGSQLGGQFLFILVSGGVCVVVALASWHLYEAHFLKLKDRFSPSPKVSGVRDSQKRGFVRLYEHTLVTCHLRTKKRLT